MNTPDPHPPPDVAASIAGLRNWVANRVWQQRMVGRFLYAYGMLWLWPFRLTPAVWIGNGCAGGTTLRERWGKLVTTQFGWVRNWRYELLVMSSNDQAHL